MTIEEVLIKMGVDSTSVASGLRGVTRMVQDAGSKMRASLNSAFNSLAAPFSAAGIVAGIKSTVDAVENLRAAAASKGVSAEFLQDIYNIGEASGMARQSIDGLLDKFVKTLPAGASVQEEFMRLADRIAGIQDPVTRAKVAIDAFGKSGIEMLRIVSGGSAGIREMAKEFSKLSEAEMQAIEGLDSSLDSASNWLNVKLGQIIGGIGAAFARLGELSAGNTEARARGEAIRDLKKMEREIEAEVAKENAPKTNTKEEIEALARAKSAHAKANSAALYESLSIEEKIHWHTVAIAQAKEDIKDLDRGSADFWKKRVELIDEEKKLADATRKREEESAKTAEKRAKIESERLKILAKIRDLEGQKQKESDDRYKPNIGELAGMRGRNGDVARRILAKEDEIKRAFGAGNIDAANRMIAELDGKEEVKGTGRLPLGRGAAPERIPLGKAIPLGSSPAVEGLRGRLKGIASDPIQERLDGINDEIKKLRETGIPVWGKED